MVYGHKGKGKNWHQVPWQMGKSKDGCIQLLRFHSIYSTKKSFRKGNIKCITCSWFLRPDSPGVSEVTFRCTYCHNNSAPELHVRFNRNHSLVISGLKKLCSVLLVEAGCSVNRARITVLSDVTWCDKSCVKISQSSVMSRGVTNPVWKYQVISDAMWCDQSCVKISQSSVMSRGVTNPVWKYHSPQWCHVVRLTLRERITVLSDVTCCD
jgi:hypothetical protein